MRLRLRFEWRDLWLGVYVAGWEEFYEPHPLQERDGPPMRPQRCRRWSAYVCVVPCLPLHIFREEPVR